MPDPLAKTGQVGPCRQNAGRFIKVTIEPRPSLTGDAGFAFFAVLVKHSWR